MSEEMTRKEVIWQLKGLLLGELRTTAKERKALEYAISSLETDEAYQLEYESTTKNDSGVDTDKLIADCEKMSFDIDFFNKSLKVVALDAVKNIVNDLPSVTPQFSSELEKNSKKLEKNFGELDCISREKAIAWAEFYIDVYDAETANESIMTMLKGLLPVTPQNIDYKAQYERLSQKAEIVISQLRADRDRLMSLPPATPIRPKGHWICDGKGRSFADYHCSECGLKLALCGQDIKQRQDSGYSLFCGGCGADMREVEE